MSDEIRMAVLVAMEIAYASLIYGVHPQAERRYRGNGRRPARVTPV